MNRQMVTHPERCLSGLLARVEMMSTGAGDRVTLPHLGEYPQNLPADRPMIVFGTSPAGVDWHSVDGYQVNLFLMPITCSKPVHLRTLTAIGKTLIIVGVIRLAHEGQIRKRADVNSFEI